MNPGGTEFAPAREAEESIVNHSQYINSTGIAKPTSLPLLSLSMPLEKIFIHVRAISDRPRFDMAIESERREAEITSICKQSNMSYDEREEQVARLKAERWQSELSARLTGKDDDKKAATERAARTLQPHSHYLTYRRL